MTDKKTEALKLALEYLRDNQHYIADNERHAYVMEYNAFVERLEALDQQPAQQHEPVAWQFFQGGKWHNGMEFNDHRKHTEAAGMPVRDLYPSPPASKPWVGLTEKEKREARNSVSYSPLAMTMGEWTEAVQDATEAKLREKNA